MSVIEITLNASLEQTLDLFQKKDSPLKLERDCPIGYVFSTGEVVNYTLYKDQSWFEYSIEMDEAMGTLGFQDKTLLGSNSRLTFEENQILGVLNAQQYALNNGIWSFSNFSNSDIFVDEIIYGTNSEIQLIGEFLISRGYEVLKNSLNGFLAPSNKSLEE